MMMPTSLGLLLLLSRLVVAVVAAAEPYLYVLYYSDVACSVDTIVSMIGFVSDNDDDIVHATQGSCAQESTCLIDSTSQQCQDMRREANLSSAGVTTFSIDQDGLIFQCDTTNTDGKCSFLDKCYNSSVYPNCRFQVKLTSELLDNPELISRPAETSTTNDLNPEHAYMIVYADAECKKFEGAQAFLDGTTAIQTTVVGASSCRESVACLFNKNGTSCQEIVRNMTSTMATTQQSSSLLPPFQEYAYFKTEVTSSGYTNIYQCENAELLTEGCHLVNDLFACQPSPYFANCHYRMASAQQLFSDPAIYLTNDPTAVVVPDQEDPPEQGDGMIATTEEDSSGATEAGGGAATSSSSSPVATAAAASTAVLFVSALSLVVVVLLLGPW